MIEILHYCGFTLRNGDCFVRGENRSGSVTGSHARHRAAQSPLALCTQAYWLNHAAVRYLRAWINANRAASDAFTRPIIGARPPGQHKCCSKTSMTFLSDAALAFATSCRSLGVNPPLSMILTPASGETIWTRCSSIFLTRFGHLLLAVVG